MAGKKGMFDGRPNKATVERRTDSWRESMQASSIMKRLKDHADGKLEKPMDATQIKAAEIILSRLVPTLSAVEQTIHDETAGMSPEQLLAELAAHLRANPEVAAALGLAVLSPNAAVLQPENAHSAQPH